jgi:hypothetical protein
MKRLLLPEPHKSLRETILDLTGERPGRVPEWHGLRTKLTLSYAQIQTGTTLLELAKRSIYASRTHSGLHEKWIEGLAMMSRGSAVKLEKVAKGSLEVFDLPLLPLLAQEPLSEAQIYDLLSRYRRASDEMGDLLPWRFPDESQRFKSKDFVPIMSVTDTENLFRYGTPHSFSVLLGIARLAESKGDVLLHLRAFQDLYRALPFILRAPWFNECRRGLIELLHQTRCRMPLSAALFDVDWDVISRQMNDQTITLCRWERPRCSATGRVVDLEDPILEAEIVPGYEIKRRKSVAARRRAKRPSSDV